MHNQSELYPNTVKMYPTNYTWECPVCSTVNPVAKKQVETWYTVMCRKCLRQFSFTIHKPSD